MGLHFGRAGVLAVVVAVAGCAVPRQSVPMAGATGPIGTIISSRQVMLQIAGAEGGVLGALSAPESDGEALAPATEFIVREGSGRIMSVMEPQPTSLRVGERVRILRGIDTRLEPLVATPPEGPAPAAT